MPSSTFGAADFKVFDVKGFQARMQEIRGRIRPKLETLGGLAAEQLAELADELTRTRDGQLVFGRAVPAVEAEHWTEAQYRTAALETFRALAPLYRLH